MTGEIVCVGTELLLGDIVNTNAQYLSRELAGLGVSVYYQSVVGDNEERLLGSIELAKSRSDIVIFSGGLGPTSDDITKETLAKALNKTLYQNNNVAAKLKDFFEKRNHSMCHNNMKQAMIPEGAIILDNQNGTAPGIILEIDNQTFVVLPGPPNELKPMFEQFVIPYIRSKSKECIISKTLKLINIGESTVATYLQEIIDNQINPTIAPYAKQSEVHLRITAKAESETEAISLIEYLEKDVYDKVGQYIYTTDEKNLEQVLVEEMTKNNMTIATAESCTGGLLSSTLINCSGASQVFMEGMITYSNESKIRTLGVRSETIAQFGAVSEETAKEMAESIKNKVGTDIGIGITGIAGPTGGTKDKPVGLVYIGIAYQQETYIKKYNFLGSRSKIRNNAAKKALIFLHQLICNKERTSIHNK